MDDPVAAIIVPTKPSFFACYLLCSLNPRFKGRTYIGFTVNPKRRIRQHNGEITSGARKTQKRRPWEMILCVHGFPSQVHALQFEWAWQHPLKSIAVRDAASELKRRGARGQVLLLFTMLNLPEWNSMNLVVNFLSTKHQPLMKGCPSLPLHMHINVGPLDDLPCYKFPCSELSSSADEGEMEENADSDGNSTEESCLPQALQEHGKTTHCNSLQGPEKNVVRGPDNSHQVLAEIDNRATSVRGAKNDARKANKLGVSKKGKPKECDKDAQRIGCSKKTTSAVSPSKKKGQPKSNKRKSLTDGELRESLVEGTLPLPLEEVKVLAASPSRFDCREVRDELNTSPCLASFATWEAYVDAPYFASPLSWDKDEAHIEPACTSSPQSVRLQSTTPSSELSLHDSVSNKTPCHLQSKTEGSSKAFLPYQAESKVVDTSVVWDLSPLWSHFGCKEDSPGEELREDSTCCRTPRCSDSKMLPSNIDLPVVPNEGTVVNTGVVHDVSPLWSPSGHKADDASFKELSAREATPCSTPPAVLVKTANGSSEKLHAQFTPLWSPSPLPVRNADALPFKHEEEREVEMNCSFSLSPLSCSPLPKPAGAAATVCGFNSMEIIDLTDSPAQESYSVRRFTYV